MLTHESVVNSLLLQDHIDFDEKSDYDDTPKINNKFEKENLRSYLNKFLDNFYKTLDDNVELIGLYEKFINEFEKPLILKTLEFCRGKSN